MKYEFLIQIPWKFLSRQIHFRKQTTQANNISFKSEAWQTKSNRSKTKKKKNTLERYNESQPMPIMNIFKSEFRSLQNPSTKLYRPMVNVISHKVQTFSIKVSYRWQWNSLQWKGCQVTYQIFKREFPELNLTDFVLRRSIKFSI